jgi:hypothetical protein
MSLKERILQLEGKVPLGQKNEAIEAIDENPYDSRGIQEEYVGHKQDPELVGVLKEIAQNCEGVFEDEGEGAESEEGGSKRSFGKGNVWHACWRAELKKRVSETTEAY